MRRVVLALALAAVSSVAVAALPARVTLVYDLARNGEAFAEVTEVVEHDGAAYSIVSEAQGKGALAMLPLGPFRRESRGLVTADGLRPDQFRDQRGARVASASFDWPARSLAMDFRGRGEVREIVGPMHDRLTLAYNFAFVPLPSDEVRAVIADGRSVTEYRYKVMGVEALETPAGTFETVRLEKARDAGDERETVIWLAPRRHHLPVRILIVERDGTRLDQVLVRLAP